MNSKFKFPLNKETLQTVMQEIKILTYGQASEILQTATERTTRELGGIAENPVPDDKTLLIVAGPNGSGKSTAISQLIDQGACPNYYICPDYLLEGGQKDEQAYLRAMRRAGILRMNAMERGASFTMETIISSTGKLDFLNEARNKGYFIAVLYIITSNPEINIRRVLMRASQGGHNVPPEKIVARYERCLSIMPRVVKLADLVMICDNSVDGRIPKQVCNQIASE